MKKAAVVGAGFAGLGIAYHLLNKGIKVDLFDQKGIGGGASGVASGLLHPYAGEQVRRSYLADESLLEAKKLIDLSQKFSIDPVADFSGIVRKANLEQTKVLLQHQHTYGDVIPLDEVSFLITSGIAVHSRRYLEGLLLALQSRGMNWIVRKIGSFEELKEYDLFFLALGAGSLIFPGLEHLGLKPVKGQSIVARWPKDLLPLQHSLIGKGYVVPLGKDTVQIGSTYERGLADEEIDLEKALEDLSAKMRILVPDWKEIEPLECKAGVRVCHLGHYFPKIQRIAEKGWVLTSMGSRGLLYHGYASKILVESALSGR